MYCSECGKQNIDNAKFCVECGTAIITRAQDRAEINVNSSLTQKEDLLDKEAAEKLKLFHEEVKRLRIINQEKDLIQSSKTREDLAEREEWLNKNGKIFKSNIERIPLEQLKEIAAKQNAKEEIAKTANIYYGIAFPIALFVCISSFSLLGLIKGAFISVNGQ